MNSVMPTPRRIDDDAALAQLTLDLDAVFGDLISDVEFADLVDVVKRGLQ